MKLENTPKGFSDKIQRHYEKLSVVFKSPQKVIATKGCYLLLENGLAIKPSQYITSQDAQDCHVYATNELLNEFIDVEMFPESDFKEYYTPGATNGAVYNPRTSLSLPVSKYGDIPARVYFRGKYIEYYR